MTDATGVARRVKTLRWIARIWSIIVAASFVLMFFLPGSPGKPILPVDKFLLALAGAAVLGLFVAWRWEREGVIFTIAMMSIREIVRIILKVNWMSGSLILWNFVVWPAIMFLIVRSLERKWKRANPRAAG